MAAIVQFAQVLVFELRSEAIGVGQHLFVAVAPAHRQPIRKAPPTARHPRLEQPIGMPARQLHQARAAVGIEQGHRLRLRQQRSDPPATARIGVQAQPGERIRVAARHQQRDLGVVDHGRRSWFQCPGGAQTRSR